MGSKIGRERWGEESQEGEKRRERGDRQGSRGPGDS